MDSEKIIEKIVDKVSNIVDEEDLIGILLFGSHARSEDKASDIDLAIIYNAPPGSYPLNVKKRINDIQVDAWFYSLKFFRDTFDSEKYRSRGDTWFKTSLWIELMREGLIIRDRDDILKRYKSMAIKWSWRKSEITPLIEKGCLNLYIAEREKDLFKKILALRDTAYIYAISYIMSKNLIPSFRPKDILTKIRLINGNVKDIFCKVHGIEYFNKEWVSKAINNVGKIILQYGSRGALIELNNARKCMRKDDIRSSILSLRSSLKYLSQDLLYKKFDYDFFNALHHVNMVDDLRQKYPDIYRLYRKIHLYGYKWINLDELAKRLRRFSQYSSGDPVLHI